MAPCKFYLQGNCKFGDRCKFDHPGANRGSFQTQNRFAALNNANPGPQGGRGGPRGGPRQDYKFGLDPDVLKQDLTGDRPVWPFSVYSPSRSGPRHLIEGPIMEQSPEEMRLRYYAAMRSGNPQQAAQEETQLLGQVNQQIQNILGDLDGACRYVQEGENIHPNRLDIGKPGATATGQPAQQQTGAFGQAKANFGQPSAFGAAARPQGPAFGQPGGGSFGAAASQQQSAFGRPTAFGASSNQQSAFGAPSALGSANPAFGKPAFGAATGFGQAANTAPTTSAAPAFGQASQPGAFGQPGGGGGAFGAQPSFGQAAGGPAFGQASQPGGTGVFGKPAGTPGFGQPAFGQAAQPAASSPFGQLGQQQQQSAGFGQAANQQAGNGVLGQQQPSGGAFGQEAAKPSPFGAPSQPQASNAFGAPSQPAATSPFGQQPATNGFGQPQQQQQQQQQQPDAGVPGAAPGADVSTYTTRGGNNQLTSFKGQPVQYINEKPCYRRPDNGQWERIWLPDGAPPENVYCHAEPQVYGGVLKEAYEFLARTGTFKDGIMPEEPPPHALCGFDV